MEGNRLPQFFRSAAPFLVSFGMLGLLVAPTLESVFSRWLKFDESYSHGFLLLLVVVFITGRKWRAEPPAAGFYPVWLFPFMLALAGYTLGGLLRVEALQELVLVPLILSVLAVLVGWDQGRKFILPIGLLVFTMPFWDYLSWTLQLITVAVNEVGLGLLGIDFRIDGVYVFLTGIGAFEVAHGCSGLRYLLVGQSLALLYGELNLRAVRSRVILFLAAVALALIANWIRVFVIIYMGYETNMQSSLIEDHDNFGWWVFAVTLVPLFLLGRYLEKTNAEQEEVYSKTASESGKVAGGRGKFVAPVIVLFCFGLVFLAMPTNNGNTKAVPEVYELQLDGETYGPLFSTGLEGWRPQITNPDRVFQKTLFKRSDAENTEGNAPPIFYAAIHSYDFQRQAAEVIQYFNRTYDSDQWRLVDVFELEGPGPKKFRGVTLQHRVGGGTIHLAYGYYVEGFWESDPLRAKLSQLRGFFNDRTDASQITFGVSCEQCDGSESLGLFIDQTLPSLVQAIDRYYNP